MEQGNSEPVVDTDAPPISKKKEETFEDLSKEDLVKLLKNSKEENNREYDLYSS